MHLSPRCQTLPLLNAANPAEQKKSYAAQNLEASGHNQDQKRNVFLWDAIMCICSTKSLSFLTQRRSSSVEMFFYCIEIICSAKSWGFWANPPSHLHLSKNNKYQFLMWKAKDYSIEAKITSNVDGHHQQNLFMKKISFFSLKFWICWIYSNHLAWENLHISVKQMVKTENRLFHLISWCSNLLLIVDSWKKLNQG